MVHHLRHRPAPGADLRDHDALELLRNVNHEVLDWFHQLAGGLRPAGPPYTLARGDPGGPRSAPVALSLSLVRFVSSHVLGHDFRTGDLELVTFAAHHLDQDRELQLAA